MITGFIGGVLGCLAILALRPLGRKFLYELFRDKFRPVGQRSWWGRIKPIKEIWAEICLRAMGRRSGPGVE